MARRRPDTPLQRRQRIRRIKGDRELNALADALDDPLLREALQDLFDAGDHSFGEAFDRVGLTEPNDFAGTSNVLFDIVAGMYEPDDRVTFKWRGKKDTISRALLEFAAMLFTLGWQAGRLSVDLERARHRLRPDEKGESR